MATLAHLFPQKKSFAQIVVPFFVYKVVKFHHKKDISLYELEMKVRRYLGVQVSRFPNNRGFIYTQTKFDSQHVIVRKYTRMGFRLWFQESISCRGGSHTSVFSWGRGTWGHEPKGVLKPQENTRVQEPPLMETILFLFPPFFLISYKKKYFHGNMGTCKIGGAPPPA